MFSHVFHLLIGTIDKRSQKLHQISDEDAAYIEYYLFYIYFGVLEFFITFKGLSPGEMTITGLPMSAFSAYRYCVIVFSESTSLVPSTMLSILFSFLDKKRWKGS